MCDSNLSQFIESYSAGWYFGLNWKLCAFHVNVSLHIVSSKVSLPLLCSLSCQTAVNVVILACSQLICITQFLILTSAYGRLGWALFFILSFGGQRSATMFAPCLLNHETVESTLPGQRKLGTYHKGTTMEWTVKPIQKAVSAWKASKCKKCNRLFNRV